MCGIAGFLDPTRTVGDAQRALRTMLANIAHRGPDDEGVMVVPPVALGHRRLSILDLSPAGHQPMSCASGRYSIVFNGEIYNHLELRARLEKDGVTVDWRGHSDTETLLQAFGAWGVDATLKLTVGMFALALWDRVDRSLVLARDRLGEKPLYYGWQSGVFMFGSELKALRSHPSFRHEIDWSAAKAFLRFNYIPAPSSIYQGISKVPPGTWLRLPIDDIASGKMPTPMAYWSLAQAVRDGQAEPYEGSFEDAVEDLEALVRQAVQLQSVADVPVGAFLSGGIDSSTVVAMMKSSTTSRVTTFSIGMPDDAYDESGHAARVARHLGTNHVEHVIQPREALGIVPELPEIWDEPFADSSQIPTHLVCKLARQAVTVALSGDGGDEFFLGYPQYARFRKLWRSRALGCLPWDSLLRPLTWMPERPGADRLFRRAQEVVGLWRQPSLEALGRHWADRYRGAPVPLLQEGDLPLVPLPALLSDPATTVALHDGSNYLPDDVLVKVDRAAMAVGLETRAPLLDHRIVEFSCRLPARYKLDRQVGKKVLREVLYRHVPREIVDRPKMGFSIPLGTWLRGDLKDWAMAQLDMISASGGPWDGKLINEMMRQHQAGIHDRTEQLWALLMMAAFLRRYRP